MKRLLPFIFLAVLIAMLLTACGGGQASAENAQSAENKQNDSTAANEKPKGPQAAVNDDKIPVEITTIQRGSISNFILLSSNLETEIQADVYARAQGIVEEIIKEEGQYVQKGEVMLKLEAEEFELAEERARVEYEKQLNAFKRMEVMHSEALLSDEEFEDARFALRSAEIAWKEAQLQLDYMSIDAPISGRVGERLTKIGERIQPADKLFSVVNTSEMIAVLYVPEKNINQLQTGQEARIYSDNIKDEEFSGRIKRVSPVVDPSSGTFKVTVGVRNSQNMLRPGMFVNVHLIIDTRDDAVLIPKTAIVYENEAVNVFVVRDSMAHKIRLDVGFEDSEKVEALSKIEEGDKVIVVGQSGLKDKTPVRIVAERNNAIASSEEL